MVVIQPMRLAARVEEQDGQAPRPDGDGRAAHGPQGGPARGFQEVGAIVPGGLGELGDGGLRCGFQEVGQGGGGAACLGGVEHADHELAATGGGVVPGVIRRVEVAQADAGGAISGR
jgi:hypothetical protein